MSLLQIENLTKEFPSVVAVDGVSFDVDDGEFVTVLGPSGSGKSTILRMIAGFEDPTDGAVVLGGEDVTDAPPFQRDVNMMFQDLALFPHLSVAENVGYGLKQSGVPADERERRVEEMLEVVRLSGYGERSPDELSGGEQQRVALARAIVNEPELVLFDEPLGSLDRKLRQHMQFELQRIQQETGITSLYVTHDQEVAMSISDRLILLNDGQIEQSGSVEDLYDSPASQFVADFIGDVNTANARVGDVSDRTTTFEFHGNGTSVALATDEIHASDDLTENAAVDLCVRPHDVRLSGDEPADASVAGTVSNRIYKGEGITYLVDSDEQAFTVNAETGEFDIGDEVFLSWDDANTYVFPSEG
ncbi:ABC transporter ATP-binding protein [Halorussus halobius]|uniref:ABC transporter ATP-binding protein n=1 Tax=Halorussus halobius TaxID=1710537 RepID=UPI001091F7B1|nr:ABC transporter ATP-binding protein [Halorussus halobius]